VKKVHVSQDEAVRILRALMNIINRRALAGDPCAEGILNQAVREALGRQNGLKK
jgi:hypothetical protein